MILKFLPYKSVGLIKFGDDKKIVHQKLNMKYDCFRKFKDDVYETDLYPDIGLIFYYDDSDGLIQIMESFCVEPIYFQGINLCDSNYKNTMKEIKKLGYKFKKTDVGYQCDELGFSLYIPVDHLEGVSFFKKGYYDE